MTEHSSDRRTGERRHMSVTEVVSIFVLILQFGALVWGAAKLSSSVDQLSVAMREIRDDVRDTNKKVETLSIDVGVLKNSKEVKAR